MKEKSESEVAQSCPTLRDPMDCSLPGSSAHGIFQARVLGAIAFSERSMLGHRNPTPGHKSRKIKNVKDTLQSWPTRCNNQVWEGS